VALPSGALAGVEALVRWEHPERGLLSPAEFVPLAERTAAIGPLTVHVLDLAMAQCRAWIDAGAALKVAVNLAAANVLDANLPDVVARALARWRVPPRLIELEISEHTVMADPRHVEEVLVRLRGMGVRLSLDDFGTGATSLAYLRRLPLDELKIDRSLVSRMTDHGDDAVIVRSTIDLARNLGLLIVAEGVETLEVLEELTALSCDMAQGFLLGRPVPAGELAPATAVLSSR